MNTNPADPNLIQRRHMVDQQIRARGVTDPEVLRAMETVPRERFIVPEREGEAFADRALPIDCDQTISQPYMVAAMTACLKTASAKRVLEIGTGSGYQTAVLAGLVSEVYTIERVAELQQPARTRLESLGITNVHYHVGDGSLGWPEKAPFDGIIVTAAAPDIPSPLAEQLAEGGRLVIPVGPEDEQILTVVERAGGRTREMPKFACRFVKLIGAAAWPG